MLLPGSPIGLTVLLALAAPPVASVDSIPIRVEFDAPAGCSSADTFYGGLLARMSRARRAMPGEDGIRLAVRLTRIGSKVRGELRLMGGGRGEGDTRRVDGETCDAVVEVLSLTAALALVERPVPLPPPPPPPPPPPSHPPPSRSSSSAQASSSSSSQTGSSSSQTSSSSSDKAAKSPDDTRPPVAEEKPPAPQDEPAAVAVVPSPPRPEPPRGRRYELGLHAVAADVISGAISLGGGLAFRLEKNAEGAGASLGLAFFYTSNDLLQKADDIAVNWTGLAATACPGWSLGRTVTLEPCARAIGGWLSASGRNLTNPSSAGRSWWSFGALLRADARLGAGFSVELEASASIPLTAHSFVTTTPERTVGQTPTISPMVALGLSRSL